MKYNLGIQIFIIFPWKELGSIVKKKKKDITKEKKEKYKAFFEGETGIFVIEKLTRT